MIITESEKLFTNADFDVARFSDQIHPRIKIRPMYFELGFSSSPHVFGRQAVVNRLLKALDSLSSDYGFVVWDVYRPRAVQEILFNWMREEIRKKSPQLNDQENFDEARKYMSPPSKVGDDYCPPHLSGGAIDLTLYEISNEKELEMGTPFDDCTERAHSDYFEMKTELSLDEEKIRNRRNLLRNIMEKVGFVSYQYEWWHFDIGDIFWSRKTGVPAVFGPLFGDQEWPEA
jgi:D-alanyl-D-alanine dipeptidase